MRRTSGCPWHARFVVQAQCAQINSTPPDERPHLASSRTCQRPVRRRAQRSVQIRRQQTRWTNPHPVSGGQTSCLGCYCGRHTRRIINPSFKHGCWQCDRWCLRSQGSQKFSHLPDTFSCRLLLKLSG